MTTSGPRQARLYVERFDPWSVAKAAFLLSLAIGVVIVVATAMLWWMLDSMGVFQAVARNVDDVVGSDTADFDLLGFLSFSRILGAAMIVASIEVVLVSALAAVFAFMYNLSVGLTGGIEVVLSDGE